MKNFDSLGLAPALLASLAKMNYTAPTPIQAQAIPWALDGHDIMGSAQTGTGKTAAFAIPLINRLLTNPHGSALVLTPTRELGKQIMDIMHQLLGRDSAINTAFIIGGEPMGKQFSQLRMKPRLIVGTPGRVNDHLDRGTLKLDDADFLVLDETDRMLDMGFTVQLERIFKHMPGDRQTLMFSATLPKNILAMSENYMHEPKRIAVGETNVVAKNIQQEVIRIEQPQKYQELQAQLYAREGSVIVFVKTKHGADRMATNLRKDGFTSEALHGDLRQTKRDKVMQNFRKQNFRVLIATDIAARGLDVPHIEHVINYDLPQVAEDFIHRMGRTARAGATGSAVSFVASQDGRKWRAIEMLINPDAANDRGEYAGAGKKKKKKPSRGKSFSDRPDSFAKPRREEREAPRQERKERFDRQDRAERTERADRPERNDRAARQDNRFESARPAKKKPFRQDGRFEQRDNKPFKQEGRFEQREQRDDKPFNKKRRFDGEQGTAKKFKSDRPASQERRQDEGFSQKKSFKPAHKAHGNKFDRDSSKGTNEGFGQKRKFKSAHERSAGDSQGAKKSFKPSHARSGDDKQGQGAKKSFKPAHSKDGGKGGFQNNKSKPFAAKKSGKPAGGKPRFQNKGRKAA